MTPEKPTPSRRFGPFALVAVLVVGLGGGAVLMRVLQPGGGHSDGAEAKQQYVCPMHPTVVQDHPGDCPICGMKLVPMKKEAEAKQPAPAERKILHYRSPHDPNRTSPTPTKDEMGMDYLPVYADEGGGDGGSGVPGLATVQIDPARQQQIGLRTAIAGVAPISSALRTTGRVVVDETRVVDVNVKIDGYVEDLFVDFVGKPVRKGQALFTLYSPELVSAQQEYLLAVRTRDALAKAGSSTEQGDQLVRSARQRLRLWDIDKSVIDELERSGEVRRTVAVTSPVSGVVTQKNVVKGRKLQAGDQPYQLTDLSEVWVLADAHQSDLARVKVGAKATLTLSTYPDREFEGRVAFIDPVIDPASRTAKVRLSFPNPKGELRPELYGEVVLHGEEREALVIPSDSVIDSGDRKIVFLALGEGKLEPREVKLGANDGEQVEVLSGLEEGDEVVTRANFLVDSESRLRASLKAMEQGQ